ncbi:MAG TPA: alpha-L-rhamnosidase C-terminal domain-containing protein [Verrucomicrobiae bacterium]|nr:alpha-L-rhamnosidase C-terminal domain-containing protein [Verrucomicrobiae bacterium]
MTAFALAVTVALLTPRSSRAGTITVGNLPATGTDPATGISPTNTYLCCIDFGNSANPPGSINGVPFIHPNLGNQVVNTTNGVDANHGGSYTITTGGPAACEIAETSSTTQGNVTNQADGNMRTLLTDLIYVGSSAPVNSWLNQTYGGLVPGHPYALRIYYRYWGNTVGGRPLNVYFNGEGSPQAYPGNLLAEDSGGAHYIEYDFTASSTNVSCLMTNLVANDSPLLYGVTLQDKSGPSAPSMSKQPSVAVTGNSIVISAITIGTPPLAYQWYFNTVSNYSGATMETNDSGVSGATTPSLTTSNNLADYYFVIVTNNYGSVTSAITAYNPAPVIVMQPVGLTNAPGTSIDLSVGANGIGPFAYQWYKNGLAIPGATNADWGYGYLRLSDAGSYSVVVTNLYGSAASDAAYLVVSGSVPPPPDFTQTDTDLVAAAAQAGALAADADTNQATTNWTAHWIGPAASYTNLWLCYRKTFSLTDQPSNAMARIAVDSKYWLWVNGQMVVREGELKREPNSNDSWYDEINLAPFLQAGSNTIAVLQWYFGKTGFSHLNSGKAGFLFEMNADGTWVRSDTTWRMVTNSAFQLATIVAQPNSRISESSLRYDMRLDLGDWTNQDFDDSGWSAPTDWGAVGGPPWGKLWLRDLPFWQELPLQDFATNAVSGTNPAVWTCYLPVNEQFTPWLDVSNASAGQIITIVPDSVAVTASPGDEYVTAAGRQSFEFPNWLSGNFVQFTVPQGVTVYGLKFRPHLADTERDGSFGCDDPFFNSLWNKAANTIGVNMQDIWGESRERANWIGDTSLILGQAPYAYDPMVELISRKCLLDLVHWQRADQTMFAPAPANYKELPVQVLAAVGEYGVMRYFQNTADLALLQQCYPAIKSYLLNVWQTNSLGLVIHRDGQWDWEDWGNNIDEPLLDNTWYLLALDAASEMAPLVGQPGDSASYLSRAQGIRNQFNASFWTEYGYRSPTNTTFTDERGNAMAVLAGLSNPSQAPVLRSVLMTNQNCSPYMEKYVEEALFKLGYPDDALARMRSRYSAMVTNSVSTLWELFPATGGFNHGWSTGPLGLLDEDVTGITPTSPGFATFTVRPALGTTLNYANANVPSPYGMISISAARDGSNYRLSVRVPPGSAGQAFEPNDGGLLSGAILSIDGGATAVMDDTANPSEISVTGGDATLVTNVASSGSLNKTGSGNLYIGASSTLSVGGFEVVTGATIVNPGGTLAVAGSVTNLGTVRLLGHAQLNVSGQFVNNGLLDIMTWSGALPSDFVNNGLVLDRSAVKIVSSEVQRPAFRLTIMGYTGHTYQLQFSSSLSPASWTNEGPPQPGNQAPLVFANNVNGGEGFYRIAVDPPGS